MRLIVPADLRRSLGDVTARRLESAAEASTSRLLLLAAEG